MKAVPHDAGQHELAMRREAGPAAATEGIGSRLLVGRARQLAQEMLERH
jgi:hypothetical protein